MCGHAYTAIPGSTKGTYGCRKRRVLARGHTYVHGVRLKEFGLQDVGELPSMPCLARMGVHSSIPFAAEKRFASTSSTPLPF